MTKYVVVREDRYIVVTRSMSRAKKALKVHLGLKWVRKRGWVKKMKWKNRNRWLRIHGNVMAYMCKRPIKTGIYTVDEFMDVVKSLPPRCRDKIEAFLSEPVKMERRPVIVDKEVPAIRLLSVGKLHLRYGSAGNRYMVPKPLKYRYRRVDAHLYCGISEFSKTVWFWVQDFDRYVLKAVIVRKDSDQPEIIDTLASMPKKNLDLIRDICGHLAKHSDILGSICLVADLV